MKNSYFFSQVHQIFFTLAFINAIIFMLTFMLSYKGILSLVVDAKIFHSFSLIFLLFIPAFLGFLFTTFPRFLASDAIKKELYSKIFLLFLLSSILLLVSSFYSIVLFKLAIFIILIALVLSVYTLYNIYKNSIMQDKNDTFYMLIGFYFSILSLIIFLSNINNKLAIDIAVYNGLFIIAFSVAQRMIPFFSHCIPIKDDKFLRNIVVILIFHTLLESFAVNISFILDLVLSIYIGKNIYKWKLPFPNENAMITILHIALFWVPIAFFISFITKILSLFNGNIFLALDIHTLLLGFLFTVLIGFGTRVTIGHSGNQMIASKYTKFLFIFTQIVVLSRIFTSLSATFSYNFMILFDISITLWLIMFILWAYKFFPVLIFGKKL